MGERLQRMREKKTYCAVQTFFPFVPALINRSLGFQKSCNLTQVSALYTEMIGKVLFDHRGGTWVESELTGS